MQRSKNVIRYILLAIPFLITELYFRLDFIGIHYFDGRMIAPCILFGCCFLGGCYCLVLVVPRTVGRIVYAFLSSIHLVFFLANMITYEYTGYCFSFTLMRMAGEGKAYIWDTVKAMNPFLLVTLVATIGSIVLAILFFPKERMAKKKCAACLGILLLVYLITPLVYGPATKELQWDAWKNPRNIYREYNDKNRSLAVSGICEYTLRDFYITFLKPEEKMTAEEKAFLEEAYEDTSMAEPNAYTGLYAGRNVIFLQMEGIDSWLVTKEDMPNLYELMQKSLQFTNHFSFYNGGGSTFNSEFAVNTGFITPFSYSRNAYTFNGNAFPYSMPRMFAKNGYSVHSIHQNTAGFYSRGENYRSWGYDGYYGLIDQDGYDRKDTTLYLDTTLLKDETSLELLFEKEQKTVIYLITYTPHTPFNTTSNALGKYLVTKEYGAEKELGEEATARLFAKETDRMIGLLMEELQARGLYEQTMIVGYTDHYLYTLLDKDILKRNGKETDSNLINRTPFFIWTADCEPDLIAKTNSQLDILPTVLNLVGIPYCPTYYIGQDILSPSYTGYVFFPDTSVYDGNVYVADGVVKNGASCSKKELEDLLTQVNRLIRKNDLTLKYDYLKGR